MRFLIASFMAISTAGLGAWACQGSVRFAAFDHPRDVHKLCVIGNREEAAAEAIYGKLAAWFGERGEGLNVELVRIYADDPDVDWHAIALPSAPPSLPVTVLVGWDSVRRRPFHVDHWEPSPDADALETLAHSPVRDAIKRDVAGHWAVLLFARGTDAQAGSAQSVLDAVVKKWAAEQAPGVTIQNLDRADPKERTLLAFIGLPAQGPDWVDVVYGRGKLMAPPLEGAAIAEDAINRLIEQLFQPCTCLQASTSPGADIPLAWETRLDAGIVALGPDAKSPGLPAASPIAAPAPRVAEVPPPRLLWIAGAVVAISMLAVGFGTAVLMWRARATPDKPAA